jgi:hypothetical protein
MAQINAAQLALDAATYLPNNGTEGISASDVRQRFIDLSDSLWFIDDHPQVSAPELAAMTETDVRMWSPADIAATRVLIEDQDKDTTVEVERTPDADAIYLKAGGSDMLEVTATQAILGDLNAGFKAAPGATLSTVYGDVVLDNYDDARQDGLAVNALYADASNNVQHGRIAPANPFVSLADSDLAYVPASHASAVIVCDTPTAVRTITINNAAVETNDHLQIVAKVDGANEYQLAAVGMTIKSLEDGSTLSSPVSMEDGMYLVHLNKGATEIWLQKIGSGTGSGGGSVNGALLRSTDSTTNYNASTPAALALDVEDIKDGNIAHSNVSNNSRFGLTAGNAGRVRVTVGICFNVSSVQRGNLKIRLRKNGSSYLLPVVIDGYSRQNGGVNSTQANAFFYVNAADGDYFEVMLSEGDTAGTITLDGSNSFVLFEQVSGLTIQTGTTAAGTSYDNTAGDWSSSNVQALGAEIKTAVDSAGHDFGTWQPATNYATNFSGDLESRETQDGHVQIRGRITASGTPGAEPWVRLAHTAPAGEERVVHVWRGPAASEDAGCRAYIEDNGDVFFKFLIAPSFGGGAVYKSFPGYVGSGVFIDLNEASFFNS